MYSPLNLLLALLPIPIFFIIYRKFFTPGMPYLRSLEFVLFGVSGGLLIVLLNSLVISRNLCAHNWCTALFQAALPEKSVLMIIMVLATVRAQNVNIIRTIGNAVLIALGFSALENIIYAIQAGSSIVIIRLFGAVPLHITTCGLMGYFYAMGRLHRGINRVVYYLAAIVIPVLVHALFDWLLMEQSGYTYFAAPLTIIMIVILDYVMARGAILPDKKLLKRLQIRFSDWQSIRHQDQYERWILRSSGSVDADLEPVFQWQVSRTRLVFIVLFIGFALFALIVRDQLSEFNLPLSRGEGLTFFALLPLFLSINLILVGSVNRRYFQSSVLRLPLICDVELKHDGHLSQEITFELNSSGCFLKSATTYPIGQDLIVTVRLGEYSSPEIKGRVIWDNHTDINVQFGTMICFLHRPPGFTWFLIRYSVRRILRGAAYNLRIPGFELLKRLFVRPESMMHDLKFLPARTVVFREGEKGAEFFMIKKGQVNIYKTTAQGERIAFANLGEGEIFGELSLLGSQPRNASAICETDCILAVADGRNLEALIKGNPDFARKLIRVAAQRFLSTGETMGANIGKLEHKLNMLSDRQHAVLVLLLLGLGYEDQAGKFKLSLDLAAIGRALGENPENVAYWIGNVFREEWMQSEQMERKINQINERYKLHITGKKLL